MNETRQDSVAETDDADGGIGMPSVVIMLAVLGLLVVGIYWGLPALFGSSVIDITIRN